MSKEKYISPDHAFKSGLESHQESFLSGDWDNMLGLLEEDTAGAVPIAVAPKRKVIFNFKNILIMTIITSIVTALLMVSDGGSQEIQKAYIFGKAEAVVSNTYNGGARALTPTESVSSFDVTFIDEPITTIPNKPSEMGSKEVTTLINDQTKDVSKKEGSDAEKPSSQEELPEKLKTAKKLLPTVDTAKFYKTVTSRYWVDTTWKWQEEKHSGDIEQAWFGVYYSNQQMENDLWDSVGRHMENHGFNLQVMSGNILKGENLAFYGGVDWGMQFYGRSEKDEVLINSVNEDRGLTFLRSHVNDVFVSGQVEWAQFPIIPYLTASAGTRIFTTGQTTRALLASTEYESTTDNGVFTRAALATKFGVGARLKASQHVHIDVRYEMFNSRPIEVVDYSGTRFNGLDYDLVKQKLDLNSSQWRFGVVFDISSNKSTRVVDKPGYWEERTQELYMDPSDSSKVFVPCPCNPCDDKKKTNRSNRRYRQPGSSGGGFPDISPGSGGGSGGGRSGFPGLKTPPIKH